MYHNGNLDITDQESNDTKQNIRPQKPVEFSKKRKSLKSDPFELRRNWVYMWREEGLERWSEQNLFK